MSCVFHKDLSRFVRLAEPLLLQNEAANSLLLGLIGRAATAEDPMPVMMTLEDASVIKSVALLTPYNLVLTFTDNDDLEDLADAIKDRRLVVPGVVGPAHETQRFARDWAELVPCEFKLNMDQGDYRLSQVTFPRSTSASPVGKMREVVAGDTPLIKRWLEEFCNEAMPGDTNARERTRAGVDQKVQNGDFSLWEYQGQPVSMAAKTRPTQNGICINAVYTPKTLRRHGHASALVAHLSQKMLETGYKFCFLFTDLTNPVSNGIYQNIGYQMVGHSRHYLFT